MFRTQRSILCVWEMWEMQNLRSPDQLFTHAMARHLRNLPTDLFIMRSIRETNFLISWQIYHHHIHISTLCSWSLRFEWHHSLPTIDDVYKVIQRLFVLSSFSFPSVCRVKSGFVGVHSVDVCFSKNFILKLVLSACET